MSFTDKLLKFALLLFTICPAIVSVWHGDAVAGRIPNAGKLAIIRAKIFNIWANYVATFTSKWDSIYVALNGKSFAETILPLMAK